MSTADRAWFQSRLTAWSAGLLDDAETARFDQLRTSDEACRLAAERFGEELPAVSSDHIPTSLLAQWPEVDRRTAGIERQHLRQHLESCASCREDLALLGFESTLSDAPATGNVNTALAVSGGPRVVKTDRTDGRRGGWFQVAIGGWAVAATAATLFLVVNRAPVVPSVAPTTSSGPAAITVTPSSLGVAPVASIGSTRGADEDFELTVSSDTHVVALELREALPPPPVDPGAACRVRILAPGASEPQTVSTTYTQLSERLLLYSNGGRPFVAGEYVVTIEIPGQPLIEKRLHLAIIAAQ